MICTGYPLDESTRTQCETTRQASPARPRRRRLRRPALARYSRAILVATGALPARDEHMARLERWTTRTIATRPGPDEQQLLHRYAVLHLLRLLRRDRRYRRCGRGRVTDPLRENDT